MSKKYQRGERKDAILTAAIDLSIRDGYKQITRDSVAIHAGVSTGLINRHYGTMTLLRRAIMRAAIAREIHQIIAQGLAAGDIYAKNAPDGLKKQATDYLFGR